MDSLKRFHTDSVVDPSGVTEAGNRQLGSHIRVGVRKDPFTGRAGGDSETVVNCRD